MSASANPDDNRRAGQGQGHREEGFPRAATQGAADFEQAQ